MLEKAYRAGFRMILLGIESASDRSLKQMNKGFTTGQVREAFNVLRRFPFYYHAYFIYGNVGESEEEMLAISRFARELGVHSISLSRLRVDQYTPMRRLIDKMPGYRISKNGYVYCDAFDKQKLRRIRDRIIRDFLLRPSQVAKMVSSLDRNEILSYGQMMRMAMAAPMILADYAALRTRKAIEHWRERRNSEPAAKDPATADLAKLV
jgi:radical SAM superfamily enzyme YgiQ (UPF0313 family)